jgi:hypothetical protein
VGFEEDGVEAFSEGGEADDFEAIFGRVSAEVVIERKEVDAVIGIEANDDSRFKPGVDGFDGFVTGDGEVLITRLGDRIESSGDLTEWENGFQATDHRIELGGQQFGLGKGGY